MAKEDFRTFEDFWPHYVREHANKANRRLHFVGTTAALLLVAGGVVTRKSWMFLAAPIAGYGCAWVGHFFIEGNTPATFQHPLWSLRGDFKMYQMMLAGEMDAEVARVLREVASTPAREDVRPMMDPNIN